MRGPGHYTFSVSAGDRDWANSVRAFDAARTAYVEILALAAVEPPAPPPPASPSGPVVDLAAWRTHKAAEHGPVATAADVYHAAAASLLKTWSPTSRELREQMRLGAELAGLPDPSNSLRAGAEDPNTPDGLLSLIYHASIGLHQAEHRRQAVVISRKAKP